MKAGIDEVRGQLGRQDPQQTQQAEGLGQAGWCVANTAPISLPHASTPSLFAVTVSSTQPDPGLTVTLWAARLALNFCGFMMSSKAQLGAFFSFTSLTNCSQAGR